MKTLIVDDNANGRKMLRLILERYGCESVVEACDGQEGLEQAKAHRPDLIISDILMPRLDGFQFLHQIKMDEELKSIPFIFHSSVYTGMKDEALAFRLGAAAFITKPKEPDEFWRELSAIMENLATGANKPLPAGPKEEERDYLKRYSEVVAAKLEEKVAALEEALSRAREAEEALRSSEIRYRRLFEASKDGILILYADTGQIFDVNPFMVDLLWYPPEEYLGKKLCETGPFSGLKTCGSLLDKLQYKDYVRFADIPLQAANGRLVHVEFVGCRYEIDNDTLIQCNVRDISERKQSEEALRESEQQRYRLHAELACAAEVQAKLLPSSYPDLPNFEIAARCLSALQVGGDFYDWTEVTPGIIAITLGDVMGKGMSAAMLMSTVRAAIHTAALQNRPADAVQLAERTLRSDLEKSESFVTLFHGHLDVDSRTLTYVDCGHGFDFLRRHDGTIEELSPRGLPLGVTTKEQYHEGMHTLNKGDALVLYSDGLIDARPALALNNRVLADNLENAASAREMVARLLALPALEESPPDDLTVLVVRCTEGV